MGNVGARCRAPESDDSRKLLKGKIVPVFLLLAAAAIGLYLINGSTSSPQPAGDAQAPGPSPNDGTDQTDVAGSALAQATATDYSTGILTDPGTGTPTSPLSPGPFANALAQTQFAPEIAQTENDCGIPQNLLARIIYQESRFNANVKDNKNPNGTVDRGICQINSIHWGEVDASDPVASIQWAGQFLAGLYASKGSWFNAVEAYNGSGPAAVAYAEQITADVPV